MRSRWIKVTSVLPVDERDWLAREQARLEKMGGETRIVPVKRGLRLERRAVDGEMTCRCRELTCRCKWHTTEQAETRSCPRCGSDRVQRLER